MARKAFVSSDMAHDEKLIQVASECPEAALLWPWIITCFDDWGRAEASTLRLKARLFPMNSLVTVDLLDRALRLFAEAGLVILYERGGKRYMAIPTEKWYKYQTHIRRNKREGKDKMHSDFPPPPSEDQGERADATEPRELPQTPAGMRGESRFPIPSPSTLPPFKNHDDDARTREDGDSLPDQTQPDALVDDPEWRELTLGVFGATYDRSVADALDQDIADIGIDAVKEAMRRSVERATGNRLSYYRTIVKGWRGKVRSLEDVRALDEAVRPPTRDPPRRLSTLELAAQATQARGGGLES